MVYARGITTNDQPEALTPGPFLDSIHGSEFDGRQSVRPVAFYSYSTAAQWPLEIYGRRF